MFFHELGNIRSAIEFLTSPNVKSVSIEVSHVSFEEIAFKEDKRWVVEKTIAIFISYL